MNQPIQGASMYQSPGLTPDQAWRRLNQRQRSFVAYYGSTPSAAYAARQAGYSPNGAKVQAHRLLTRPEVQAALRWDRGEMARALAQSYMPEIITSLAKEADDDRWRLVDRARARHLLMEIAGSLKWRRGRRR